MHGFCCPACRQPLAYQGDTDAGYGACHGCGVYFPCVQGMLFFDKPTLAPLSQPSLLAQLCQQLFGDEAAYETFVQAKHLRPTYDAYAAFQPFNESTRALYCLFDEIKRHLKPGQAILDLWGRTGWSGEALAAYFPDNPVYMVWEGDRNVLGYKGYHYWLKQGRRAANLHILFTDLEKPLPFADDFFGLVHGLDTFHRYSPVPLLAECLRVSLPSAPIVFPHIHLTNSEPDPYFDRGCTQYHGRVYRQWMDKIQATHGRAAYLLSEKTLFTTLATRTMVDEHDMAHYNALLYIAPAGVTASYLTPCHWPETQLGHHTQVILNPLLGIEPVTGEVSIEMTAMGGQGAHLLTRHPVYHERLKQHLPRILEDTERQLLFCLHQGLSLTHTSRLLGMSLETLQQRLQRLQAYEICTYLNVSPAMAALQRFYATQRLDHPWQHQTEFREVWQAVLACPDKAPAFISTAQDIEYAWPDVQQLVHAIRVRFVSMGLKPGDKILLCAKQHPAYLLTIWAAWLSGLIVVPVCPLSQTDSLAYILDLTQPAMIFAGADLVLTADYDGTHITFDALNEEAAPTTGLFFSDWLAEIHEDAAPAYQHCETAAILFSSGTTGQPKAIGHSFYNLLSGTLKLSSFYHLSSTRRVLSAGGFHTMSGLRNAAVLPLANQQTLLLADAEHENMLQQFLHISRHYQPELVFSTPALLDALDKLKHRLEKNQYASIKLWLCTGASISCDRLTKLSAQLGIRFGNYYGLTETGGFCAGTSTDTRLQQNDSIGKPVGALFRIVNQEGLATPSGEEGLLEVFSDQLMLGYLAASQQNGAAYQHARSADGWLATGDLVRRQASGDITLLGRNDDAFNTPAGELIHLGHLELRLKDKVNIEFALLDQDGQLLVVLECEHDKLKADLQQPAVTELLALLRSGQYGNISQVAIRRVATIPKTANGKIQRPLLRQMLAQPLPH